MKLKIQLPSIKKQLIRVLGIIGILIFFTIIFIVSKSIAVSAAIMIVSALVLIKLLIEIIILIPVIVSELKKKNNKKSEILPEEKKGELCFVKNQQ